MSTSSEGINKPLVGILAIVCLATAGILAIVDPEKQAAIAAFLRVGAVMAALWFALPKPGEEVRWARFAPILLVAVVAIVLTRKMILVLLPAVIVAGIVLTLLRPKSKRRPRSRV